MTAIGASTFPIRTEIDEISLGDEEFVGGNEFRVRTEIDEISLGDEEFVGGNSYFLT